MSSMQPRASVRLAASKQFQRMRQDLDHGVERFDGPSDRSGEIDDQGGPHRARHSTRQPPERTDRPGCFGQSGCLTFQHLPCGFRGPVGRGESGSAGRHDQAVERRCHFGQRGGDGDDTVGYHPAFGHVEPMGLDGSTDRRASQVVTGAGMDRIRNGKNFCLEQHGWNATGRRGRDPSLRPTCHSVTMGMVDRDQVPTTALTAIGNRAAKQSTDRSFDGPEHEPDGLEVSATALSHTYVGPAGEVPVLVDLSFTVPRDGYAALVGPSGAGKTTLLSLIGGLEQVQSGTLRVGGHDVAALEGDELAAYRRSTVGFIFQNFGLLEALTAVENVELAAMLAGDRPARRRTRAAELLDAVGMSPRAAHRPGALSGGECQRVAIARALVNGPRLVLADEPTGNLDADTSEEVMLLLESMRRERGCTLLVVTHDRGLARRAAQLLVLDRGRIRDSVQPDTGRDGADVVRHETEG